MVVIVKLRLVSCKGRSPGASLEAPAGVNTHYPALLGPDQPELLIPVEVGRELGIYPPEPSWKSLERSFVGGPVYGWFLESALEAAVIEPDRSGNSIRMHAYITPGFSRVLISDAGIKPLGIWLVDEARGYWCFPDELRDVLDGKRDPRASYKPR